jgi:hypothetical protein
MLPRIRRNLRAPLDRGQRTSAIFIELRIVGSKRHGGEEMANHSAAGSKLIDRRTALQVAAALAVTGPALMREGRAATRPPVVIDAQVHAYAANTPERPWYRVPNCHPLRRTPAIVSFLNPWPALSLVGGNCSSCPFADLCSGSTQT